MEAELHLLDTSFIKGNSGQFLDGLAKEHLMCAPPYTVWESMSHLSTDWQRARGNLRKYRWITILDNPMALLEPFQNRPEGPAEWPNEESALRPLLTNIDAADSFDEFCRNSTFQGMQRPDLVAGCIETAKKQLEILEVEHLQARTSIRKLVAQEQKGTMDDDTLSRLVLQRIQNFAVMFKKGGAIVPNMEERLTVLMYYHFGYVYLLEYEKEQTGAKPRENDYEDSFLFQHIHLDNNTHLYTRDGDHLTIGNRLAEHVAKVRPLGYESRLCITRE